LRGCPHESVVVIFVSLPGYIDLSVSETCVCSPYLSCLDQFFSSFAGRKLDSEGVLATRYSFLRSCVDCYAVYSRSMVCPMVS